MLQLTIHESHKNVLKNTLSTLKRVIKIKLFMELNLLNLLNTRIQSVW